MHSLPQAVNRPVSTLCNAEAQPADRAGAGCLEGICSRRQTGICDLNVCWVSRVVHGWPAWSPVTAAGPAGGGQAASAPPRGGVWGRKKCPTPPDRWEGGQGLTYTADDFLKQGRV